MITAVAMTIAKPSRSPPHPFAIPPQSPERTADPMTTHHVLSLAVYLMDSTSVGGFGTGFSLRPNL